MITTKEKAIISLKNSIQGLKNNPSKDLVGVYIIINNRGNDILDIHWGKNE